MKNNDVNYCVVQVLYLIVFKYILYFNIRTDRYFQNIKINYKS